MEQNINPTNKPMLTWSSNFWQGCQECTMEKRQSPQLMVLVKLDIHIQNKWNWILTVHYTQRSTQNDSDLNLRAETIKFLEENIRKKLLDNGLGTDFLAMTLKAQETNMKINK